MDYIIRLATEKDCVELSKLKQRVWNETYRGIYSDEKIDNYDFKNVLKRIIGIDKIDIICYYIHQLKGEKYMIDNFGKGGFGLEELTELIPTEPSKDEYDITNRIYDSIRLQQQLKDIYNKDKEKKLTKVKSITK